MDLEFCNKTTGSLHRVQGVSGHLKSMINHTVEDIDTELHKLCSVLRGQRWAKLVGFDTNPELRQHGRRRPGERQRERLRRDYRGESDTCERDDGGKHDDGGKADDGGKHDDRHIEHNDKKKSNSHGGHNVEGGGPSLQLGRSDSEAILATRGKGTFDNDDSMLHGRRDVGRLSLRPPRPKVA